MIRKYDNKISQQWKVQMPDGTNKQPLVIHVLFQIRP